MKEENERSESERLDDRSEMVMPSLMRNYISFVGIAIAAASFTSFVLLFMIELTGETDNPYTDLVTFIFVPSVLVFGLFLIALGALIERRRRRGKSPEDIAPFPIIDLNDPKRRRTLIVFGCLSFAFLFLSAFGSYRAFEYTESVVFCGQACHTVMEPEFVSYQASPHASIACVECHVGSGADAYVQAKLSGMRQLYGVMTGHYNRPIQTPVHNLRSATETCQKCHWSEKYHGDVLKVFNHYAYDEANTLNQTRMLLKVGGGNASSGPVGGIHWHMNLSNDVEFVYSDERRQVIPWVKFTDATGKVTEYRTADFTASQAEIDKMPHRKMDCVDCHSRPAHDYLSPARAVDVAFDAGKLDQSIPFLKARAVEALAKEYETKDEALAAIARDINQYYQTTHPDVLASKGAAVAAAVSEVQRLYQTYFFPEMKTDWRAHINNIGHFNAQGCFRCHDGQHFSKEGKPIRNDCAVCHTTLSQTYAGSTFVPENGVFRHPVELGTMNTYQCAACHKGDKAFVHPLNLGDISRFQCAECHKGNPGY